MEGAQLQPVQGDDQNTEADVASLQCGRVQPQAQRVPVLSIQCRLLVSVPGVKGD